MASNDTETAEATQLKPCGVCRPKKRRVNYCDVNGKTLLMGAAQRGHVNCAKSLIQQGAKVNAVDSSGDTALIRATQTEQGECMEVLVGAGADVNKTSDYCVTALIQACRDEYIKGVKMLLKAGASTKPVKSESGRSEESALMNAIDLGNLTVINLLLESGADVNAIVNEETPLMKAASEGRTKVVKRLIEAGASVNTLCCGETALYSGTRSEKMTKTLLAAGADVNINGKQPLLLAAIAEGSPKSVIELLIKTGAPVNTPGDSGSTCLHVAVNYSQPDVVKLLLENSANVNARGFYGDTPLLCAARHDSCQLIDMLLKAGADVNVANSDGDSALIRAASRNSLGVKSLIKAGSSVNHINNDGETALTKVPFDVGKNTTRLLLKAGALINVGDIRTRYNPPITKCSAHLVLFAAGVKSFKHLEDSLECELDLKNLCRKAVRKELLEVAPNAHLFGRIPLLGLPTIVNEYLLYGQALEDEEKKD